MASKPRLAEQQRAVTLLTQAVNILRNDSVVPSPATISPQSEIVRLFSPYRCTNTTGKVRGGSGTSGGCFSGNTSFSGNTNSRGWRRIRRNGKQRIRGHISLFVFQMFDVIVFLTVLKKVF